MVTTDTGAHRIIDTDDRVIVLDLSRGSLALGERLGGIDVGRFSLLIDQAMDQAGTRYAFGRWGERRELYGSEHFAGGDGGERRDVHLGVDLFCDPGTEIRSPLPARVHATANNARELDYGPVVILEHDEGNGPFYTLYGHLADNCLGCLAPGQGIEAGEVFAQVGAPPTNGNWPPHLHFQLILDLLDLATEFPGVAAAGEANKWLSLSPLPARFFPGIRPEVLDGR